jgi:tetratricopeptide (TPR) repeat protein
MSFQALPLRKMTPRKFLILALAPMLLAAGSARPANTQTQKDMAYCLSSQATPAQTIEGCTAMIDSGHFAAKDMTNFYDNRGIAYVDTQQYDRAKEDFTSAITLDDMNVQALGNRAGIYILQHDYDSALKDLSAAMKAKPDYAQAYYDRAEAYSRMGRHADAVRDYDQAIKLQPNNPSGFNGRCWNRAILGQFSQALADCNQSLKLAPNRPNTLDSRGLVYLKLQKFDAAIADYDAALKQDPQLDTALYGRGLAKHIRGERSSGDADIAAAKAITPDIAEQFAHWGVPAK